MEPAKLKKIKNFRNKSSVNWIKTKQYLIINLLYKFYKYQKIDILNLIIQVLFKKLINMANMAKKDYDLLIIVLFVNCNIIF